jgi:general secretion pathway protein H
MKASAWSKSGLTLIELLVVLALIGVVTVGVRPALRDPAQAKLREEADRLAALLESGRAASRAHEQTLLWQVQAEGFRFEGLAGGPWPTQWLYAGTQAQVAGTGPLELGPEPIIAAQAVRLYLRPPAREEIWIGSDGVEPFAVRSPLGPADPTAP